MFEYPLQIIGLAFSLFLLYSAYRSFRRGEFDKTDFVAWLLIIAWFAFALVFPNLLQSFVSPLKIVSVFELILLSAVAVLFLLVFFLHKKIGGLEKKIEIVVRKTALERRKNG